MFVLSLSVYLLFFSSPSFAFLDFLSEEAKKTAEKALYVESAVDLVREISSESSLIEPMENLEKSLYSVEKELVALNGLSEDTKRALLGPGYSKDFLDNIKRTTQYIRRVKELILKTSAFGLDGAIAANTLQTTKSLNDVQKNQQLQIYLMQKKALEERASQLEETKRWNRFISQERSKRGKK